MKKGAVNSPFGIALFARSAATGATTATPHRTRNGSWNRCRVGSAIVRVPSSAESDRVVLARPLDGMRYLQPQRAEPGAHRLPRDAQHARRVSVFPPGVLQRHGEEQAV